MIRFLANDSVLGYRQFCWHNIMLQASLVVNWCLPIATINEDAYLDHKLPTILLL